MSGGGGFRDASSLSLEVEGNAYVEAACRARGNLRCHHARTTAKKTHAHGVGRAAAGGSKSHCCGCTAVLDTPRPLFVFPFSPMARNGLGFSRRESRCRSLHAAARGSLRTIRWATLERRGLDPSLKMRESTRADGARVAGGWTAGRTPRSHGTGAESVKGEERGWGSHRGALHLAKHGRH